MKKIVFSDVDGTLLNKAHEMTELTVGAVHKLRELEIPFVIISARSPSGIYPIKDAYDIKGPTIAYSGGLILDENKKVLYHKGMPKAQAQEIITHIEEKGYDLSYCIYSIDQWVVKDKKDPRIIDEENIVKAQAMEGTVKDVVDEQINKILCICNPDELETIEADLKAKFPDLSIVKSSNKLLEIMPMGMHKAVGVTTLCKLWDIPLENVAVFGDNYNDVEMLSCAGHGFLMGNAPAKLQEQLKGTVVPTKDNENDGIYHGLKSLNWI